MRQFNVYIRLYAADQWSHGGTFQTASHAWAGMMMARARGFSTKVTGSTPVAVDTDVLAVQS